MNFGFFSMLDQDKANIDAVKAIPVISPETEILNFSQLCFLLLFKWVIKALPNIYDADFSGNS